MSLGLIHRRRVHPFAALREAERAFDELHRRRRVVSPVFRTFDPRLQAHETEAGWEVSAELPGVSRDDLEVFVQDGVLTIRGARRYGRPEAPAIEATNADAPDATEATDGKEAEAATEAPAPAQDDANVARFERKIRFNGDVDEANVSARYADGVLEVSVPRSVPPEPEVRTIPIQVG